MKVKWNILYPTLDTDEVRIKFERVYRGQDTNLVLLKLLRKLDRDTIRTEAHYSGKNNGGGFCPYNSQNKKQFCVTKMRYSKSLASHKRFLKTYMVQKEKEHVKEKPVLFGTEDYEKTMTGLHFKFIISPENQDVPLEQLTRAFVKLTEIETGYKLHWQAAIHTDTANKHVHLLINGIDKNKKRVKFMRTFIKQRIHELTSNVCTQFVGERTREDVMRYKQKSLVALRWTKHDEIIEKLVRPYEDNRYGFAIRAPNEVLRRRLIFLEESNIAKYENGIFYLEKNWKDTLWAVGRYNSFLTVRSDLQFSLPCDLTLYSQGVGTVTGKVKKVITMDDENTWNNAIVVENDSEKKAWYIPLFTPPKKNLIGKDVEYGYERNRKGKLLPFLKAVDDKSVAKIGIDKNTRIN